MDDDLLEYNNIPNLECEYTATITTSLLTSVMAKSTRIIPLPSGFEVVTEVI